jgi:hypothetical protein
LSNHLTTEFDVFSKTGILDTSPNALYSDDFASLTATDGLEALGDFVFDFEDVLFLFADGVDFALGFDDFLFVDFFSVMPNTLVLTHDPECNYFKIFIDFYFLFRVLVFLSWTSTSMILGKWLSL